MQGSRTTERTGGGLGIGLTLVRNLTELHGGTVTAHSDGPGRGSTFTVRLPRVELAAKEPERRQNLLAGAPPRRILIVDDNEDALVLLADALTAAGHEVMTAVDPAQALVLLEEFEPELAILDIGLPVMDGYELAAKIRERRDGSPPRMFALTGFGQPNDREKSREAGFSAHFVKPVDVKQLIESIAKA